MEIFSLNFTKLIMQTIFIGFILINLTACGQYGPLELPNEEQQEEKS